MIDFTNKAAGERILELGGGANRNPAADVMVDVRQLPGVDFVADFNKPLPIADADFTVVLAHFVLEHITYRVVPQFLRECLRILKPGGRVFFAVPNTEAQLRWVLEHPEGWDGKNMFESASEKLFGSQNMPDDAGTDHNSHMAYFSPDVAQMLFVDAGFCDVLIQPYGERQTDMVIQARKPNIDTDKIRDKHGVPLFTEPDAVRVAPNIFGTNVSPKPVDDPSPDKLLPSFAPGSMGLPNVEPTQFRQTERVQHASEEDSAKRAALFDKHYFNGGTKVGGYGGVGYQDFPIHWCTFEHVMARKPTSVFEIGCGRGYILKRLINAGIFCEGIDISRHAWMTRVCPVVRVKDCCRTPWHIPDSYVSHDLCFSVGVLDHIPEEFVPVVIQEQARFCKRGLHGVGVHPADAGDQTRCTVRSLGWWKSQFAKYAPDFPVEIVTKESLETPEGIPEWNAKWNAITTGDGKIKLNVGSFIGMTHHGWDNIDTHDLANFAAGNGFRYKRHDIRQGLPYPSVGVDAIFAHHVFEHLTYDEGKKFLLECRRVLRPSGALRLVVPNAAELIESYRVGDLSFYDEINDGCGAATTSAVKLWSLLLEQHKAIYDPSTLITMLENAGFDAFLVSAWNNSTDNKEHPVLKQIVRETQEMDFGGLSLFVEAVPRMD